MHGHAYSRREALGLGLFGVVSFGLVACGRSQSTKVSSQPSDGLETLTPGLLSIASNLFFPPLVVEENDASKSGFGYEICEDLADAFERKLSLVECASESEVFDAITTKAVADLGATTYELGALSDEIVSSNALMHCDLCMVTRSQLSVEDAPSYLLSLDSPVLVQDSLVAKEWAKAELGTGAYTLVPDVQDALQAVRENQAGAAVVLQVEALYFLESVYTTLSIASTMNTDWVFGFVARKENDELMAALNATMSDLRDSGSLASLETRWFGRVV